MPCARYPELFAGRAGLPDSCRGAPDLWIQRPVLRVSSLSFPSQSRVTASTLKATPTVIYGVWRLPALPSPKGNPALSPSGMRV